MEDGEELIRLEAWLEQAADALFSETKRSASNDVLRVPAMPAGHESFDIVRGQ